MKGVVVCVRCAHCTCSQASPEGCRRRYVHISPGLASEAGVLRVFPASGLRPASRFCFLVDPDIFPPLKRVWYKIVCFAPRRTAYTTTFPTTYYCTAVSWFAFLLMMTEQLLLCTTLTTAGGQVR